MASESPNAVPEDLKGTQMSVLIATALDSEAAHTSFGKLPLADEKSAPIYGFGTSTRKHTQKVYMGEELTVTQGQASPGPKYRVKENPEMPSPPKFSIGKDERAGPQQHYDFYDIPDSFTNPVKSKQYTLREYGSTKFGTSTRAPQLNASFSPGPQYNPPHRQEQRNAPRFSLGARRVAPGSLSFGLKTSTPALVGPGRYAPERAGYTSMHQSPRKWSVPKQERRTVNTSSVSKHQTYDASSASCGPQYVSKRRTSPGYGFGTATRDHVKRTGMFQDAMSMQQAKVRIPLPASF